MDKLELFESLVDQKSLTKAAIVAEDITYTIETFNPIDYFPKLFSKYFSLQAQCSKPLQEEIEAKQNPQWQALEQLYKVDVELLQAGNSDSMPSSIR